MTPALIRRARPRRLAPGLAAAAALALSACSLKDKLLTAPDPDIINAADVSSPDAAVALRNGATARFVTMTAGGESTWLLGGMLADEYRSGDTFTERDETDKRQVQTNNGNVNTAYRNIHRTRLSANQAIAALKQFRPTVTSDIAEMYLYRGWAEWQSGADFCNGQPFSALQGSELLFGTPVTSAEAFALALATADSGLAVVGGATDTRSTLVRNALRTLRARILVSLNRFPEAATAAQGVPTDFVYTETFKQTSGDNAIWSLNISQRRWTVADRDGANGLPFVSASDPRVPTCAGGTTECRPVQPTFTNRSFDNATPLVVSLLAPTRETPWVAMSGVEARLVEAEARLKAGDAATALSMLNALRRNTALYACPAVSAGVTNASCRAPVAVLADLADAGTADARVEQLFRERAFWLFNRGTRLEDLRRLIRQYGRSPEAVFPTGAFGKGGTYGTDVNFPVTQAEQNNPNFTACSDRKA